MNNCKCYSNHDDVESLLEQGWIAFIEAFPNLVVNRDFMHKLNNNLEQFLNCQLTIVTKVAIESMVKSLVRSHLNESLYEFKVASFIENPNSLVVLARKI